MLLNKFSAISSNIHCGSVIQISNTVLTELKLNQSHNPSEGKLICPFTHLVSGPSKDLKNMMTRALNSRVTSTNAETNRTQLN
jgi:hypothetical protein